MRELEVCHMSVISLSSPVVSLLLLGFSFEPVGTVHVHVHVHKEKRDTRILANIFDDKSGHMTVILQLAR